MGEVEESWCPATVVWVRQEKDRKYRDVVTTKEVILQGLKRYIILHVEMWDVG